MLWVFCQGQTKVSVWLGSSAEFWEALHLLSKTTLGFILVTVFITLTFTKRLYFLKWKSNSSALREPAHLHIRGQRLVASDHRCLSPAFLISAASALCGKVTSTDLGDRYMDR